MNTTRNVIKKAYVKHDIRKSMSKKTFYKIFALLAIVLFGAIIIGYCINKYTNREVSYSDIVKYSSIISWIIILLYEWYCINQFKKNNFLPKSNRIIKQEKAIGSLNAIGAFRCAILIYQVIIILIFKNIDTIAILLTIDAASKGVQEYLGYNIPT